MRFRIHLWWYETWEAACWKFAWLRPRKIDPPEERS